MKKFVAILALAATMFAVNAQAQNKEVAAAKAALEKAQAAAENPKQNTKLATWLKYGETLVKAYAAPSGAAWVGMSMQEFQMLANERAQSESQVTIGGEQLTKRVFANKNMYFNEAGQLTIIEVTQPVVENPLDKALEAYAKAAELDPKGTKTKEIKAALEDIASKFSDEAYNAYNLGNMKAASEYFEKSAKASATAPLSVMDSSALYNAGFVAWASSDWNRARTFLEQCEKAGYTEKGEVYAKLADVANGLGDGVAAKKYLETGMAKFPENQSVLIGLINYYLNSGEDTARLFELFEDAKKNEPDNASLYYVEGNARKKLGQNEEALVAYDQATKVNPKYEWGYIGKGIQLYDMAVELQDKANNEMDNDKYMALMGEFEKCLKGCIEPFETAFELVKDDEIKVNLAEYLKNACFRFRNEGEEFQAKYDKYNAVASQR